MLKMIYMKMWSCKVSSDRHALDVLIDERDNVWMPSQINVKSIMAYVEARESRIFKSTIC